MQIIPLSQNYSALFNVELDGELYQFRTLYNSRFGNWSFDLFRDDVEIATGISMILGSDIVDQFNLGVGVLFMVDLETSTIDANAFDIGERVVLVHTTEEEIADAFTV